MPLYQGGIQPPRWYHRDLEEGDTGNDVTHVQAILGLPQTGIYDDTTASFIRGLQRKAGLRMSGKVDKKTAGKLGDRSTKDLTPKWFSRDIKLRDTIGDDVVKANELLGTPDEGNVLTAESESAVRRIQSEHGLTVTGVIDAETARLIGE